MSRIGNKIIPVPSGVKIQIKDDAVEVQGPKGKMRVVVPKGISFELGKSTRECLAREALRILVSKSAIGSVVILPRP